MSKSNTIEDTGVDISEVTRENIMAALNDHGPKSTAYIMTCEK